MEVFRHPYFHYGPDKWRVSMLRWVDVVVLHMYDPGSIIPAFAESHAQGSCCM